MKTIITTLILSTFSMFSMAQYQPNMSSDSTQSLIMSGPSVTPIYKVQTTNAQATSIQLPYRQLYQCPSLLGGSLGGGNWGYYGCHGQIGYESTCMTIEDPTVLNSPCTPIN